MMFTTIVLLTAILGLSVATPLHPSEPAAQSSISTTTHSSTTSTSAVTASSSTRCATSTPEPCRNGSCADQIAQSLPTSLLPNALTAETVGGLQALLAADHLQSSLFFSAADNASQWDASGSWNDSKDVIERLAHASTYLMSTKNIANQYQQKAAHVHILESLLRSYNVTPVAPCLYTFGIHGWKDFIHVARAITTVSSSALVGLISDVVYSEPLLAGSISSLLAMETSYNAFMLCQAREGPAAQPLKTGIHMLWAHNLAQRYMIPGSCPIETSLPVFPILQVHNVTKFGAGDQLKMTWSTTPVSPSIDVEKPLYAAWINQLSPPVYTNVTIEGPDNGYSKIPDGLSGEVFLALTSQQVLDKDLLEWGTLAGPALLEVV